MSNKEKLITAQKLLNEVVEDWKEENISKYGSKFSFDELVAEINTIELID